MLRKLLRLARLTAWSLVLAPAASQAQTITFDALGGANGSAFTTYTEGGFNVDFFGGFVCVAQLFGNPTPDLFVGSAGGTCAASVATGSIRITRSGGGLFNLISADFAANNGNAPYTFDGRLGGPSQYVVSDVALAPVSGFAFFTHANPQSATSIDELIIELTALGTSANVDNIVLSTPTTSAAPEPASWLLIATGFTALTISARRRRSRR